MIYTLTEPSSMQNTYVIEKENKCVLIDCGYANIVQFLQEKKLECVAILLTHGHFDHCCEVCKIKQVFNNAKVFIHQADEDKTRTDNNLAKMFNLPFENFICDGVFDEGAFEIEDFDFEILHTPGHSEGSCCIVYEDNIFTGDTLFENGYGRFDFYDGSFSKLKDSLRKLKSFKDKKHFYGHSGV